MNASIILGSQFGDEGKGKTTDFLCTQSLSKKQETIVVRFSGGQQAGHNVKVGDISHVHSNFGSGTLSGVPSFFSEHCTIYPTTIHREKLVLEEKGITPTLYLHPLAKVTTPFDVAYNKLTEKKNNHGSCGLGIAATMKRNLETGHKLFAIDLCNRKLLFKKLINIQKYYYDLIKNQEDHQMFNDFENEDFRDFLFSLDELEFQVKGYDFLKNYESIIFEGSQGILLDMDHGTFPNVTFANTTSKNALEICKKLEIDKSNIDIYYTTRCYQTRHGNGWMSNENPIKLINTNNEINVYNQWQKNFKVREIDYELINYALDVDNIYSDGYNKHLLITCLDQRPNFVFDYEKMTTNFKSILLSASPESIYFNKDIYL